MSNQKQDLKDVEHLLNYRILVFNSFDMIAMVDLDLGYLFIWAGIFPGGSDSKESACNAGDQSLTPRLRRSPGGGYGNSLQYSCMENACGQRSLVGYSPWGHKESGTTKQLSTVQHRYVKQCSITLHIGRFKNLGSLKSFL